MLTVNQVKYHYHNEMFAFDLEVQPQSIVALMGPSGAGKSTLLALMAGFIDPVSGDITVSGQSVLGEPPHKRPFAMLFQEHNLFAHLSVRDNIGLGIHPGLKLSQSQREQIEKAAQLVGLTDYLDRLPEQLSGGQRQRVALARCFVQPHPVWLLDEPFSALDPILREEMLVLVQSLAKERGVTVVMVTHHLSDAKAIASHFAFMADGRVDVTGEISQLNEQHDNAHLREFVAAGQ
ncbi:thiamine ABC transporter ATP-binding protein [Vibrio sp. TRT 17S01]|uniref:thiamine ABC transporter ATP-binding protein n=1 Tax=Vibrio sp. TRT 17S01 TaxID=3418505 RepID=UPI003CE95EEB